MNLPAGHERIEIDSGYSGTAQTIDKMQELVSEGKRNFDTRIQVGQIIKQCGFKNYKCQVEACLNFCRNDIKYAFDPHGVELVERPYKTLQSGIADCDSVCVLLACMCETLGFPCRYVTIKADKGRPDEFSHVYLEVKIPKHGWVGADATMPYHLGWQPPDKFEKKRWPASKDEYSREDMEGMAGMNYMAECGLGDTMPGVSVGTDPTYSETEFRDENSLDPYTQHVLETTPLGGKQVNLFPWHNTGNPYGANLIYTRPGMDAEADAKKKTEMKGLFGLGDCDKQGVLEWSKKLHKDAFSLGGKFKRTPKVTIPDFSPVDSGNAGDFYADNSGIAGLQDYDSETALDDAMKVAAKLNISLDELLQQVKEQNNQRRYSLRRRSYGRTAVGEPVQGWAEAPSGRSGDYAPDTSGFSGMGFLKGTAPWIKWALLAGIGYCVYKKFIKGR